jgi:hypothetical protein
VDRETKAEFERLNKKLNDLLSAQRKATWIGPTWVTDLTGWTPEEMRQARQHNIIEFKRSPGGGYLYKLESIPEQFIKQKQAS